MRWFYTVLLYNHVTRGKRELVAVLAVCSFERPFCGLSQLMRLCYLSHTQPAKTQASLRILTVSPEPSLFAHMKYGNRRSVRSKIRHLTPLWWPSLKQKVLRPSKVFTLPAACFLSNAVKIHSDIFETFRNCHPVQNQCSCRDTEHSTFISVKP